MLEKGELSLTTGIAALLIALLCAVLLLSFFVWKLTSHVSSTALSISSRLDAFASSQQDSSSPANPSRLDAGSRISYGNLGANVELFPCSLPSIDTLKPLDMPETIQRSISDFVLDTANLFAEASGVRTLAIRFSPDVARQLKNGQLELMKSAFSHKPIAIDPNNGRRILELGDIVSSINPVATVAFVWQILAVVTAKKFLADIDKKLGKIGKEIHDIRTFLIDAEESELIANYYYLVQVTQSVLMGNLGPDDVVVIGTQLEDIERQSSRTMHLMLKRARQVMENIKKEHDSQIFEKGFNKCCEYNIEMSEEFTKPSRICLLALAVRSAATYTRAALPLNKAITRTRLIQIEDDFDSYTQLKSNFSKRIHDLNNSIKGKRVSWNNEHNFIQHSREELDKVLLRLDSRCQEVQSGIESVSTAVDDKPDQEVVYAQVNGGEVRLFNSATAKNITTE